MVIALLMAGQHTSSSASSWIMLWLAARLDIMEELYREQVGISWSQPATSDVRRPRPPDAASGSGEGDAEAACLDPLHHACCHAADSGSRNKVRHPYGPRPPRGDWCVGIRSPGTFLILKSGILIDGTRLLHGPPLAKTKRTKTKTKTKRPTTVTDRSAKGLAQRTCLLVPAGIGVLVKSLLVSSSRRLL